MGRKKQDPEARLLTDLELELMQTLWDLGEGTVKDVLARLPQRPLAYTSVATVMKILEGKKVVASRKTDRAHVYYPLLTRADYEAKSVQNLLGRVFRSDPGSLVMRLLDEAELSPEDVATIRKLLDAKGKK
jgi:predicted transcriptional regulator